MTGKEPVENLQSKLYSRTAAPEIDPAKRTPLRQRAPEVPKAWQSDEAAENPTEPVIALTTMTRHTKIHTFARYFMWGSIAFFGLALLAAEWTLSRGTNTITPSNIDMQIVAPSLIDSGKGATIQYIVANHNKTALLAADLIVDYPDGTRSQDDPTTALPRARISLGDIQPGQQIKQTLPALFFGSSGAQEKISVTLEYQIAGSNAIFVKQADTMFTIGSSPVSVTLSAPTETVSGSQFDFDVQIASNATSPISNVALQMQYPFGFSISAVSPAAAPGNTLWHLGDLQPGASKTVHISGVLVGEEGDERVFHVLVGSESDPTETVLAVPILSVPQTITVHKPYIGGTITLGGVSGKTISEPLGSAIPGTITWQNNLTETLSNVTFTLSLGGAAIDPASVQANNGFYDSNKQQIVWSSDNNSDLASVPPGASGSLQFSFATLPQSAGVFTNPEASLLLSATAVRQGGGAPVAITGIAQTKVTFTSNVSLGAQALHFSGPFSETGPMPPVVGQSTTYAIVLSLKNSSNALADGVVSTVLPPYVTFVGADMSSNEQVSYDDTTRTVTWSLGDVKAGAGYTSAPRQAAFQVSFTPSLSQVGSSPQLTGSVGFQGTDRFAQTSVTSQASAPTTQLTSDQQFSQGMGVVSK